MSLRLVVEDNVRINLKVTESKEMHWILLAKGWVQCGSYGHTNKYSGSIQSDTLLLASLRGFWTMKSVSDVIEICSYKLTETIVFHPYMSVGLETIPVTGRGGL
jgi:hypothetical protein